jgi:hypothetical protein
MATKNPFSIDPAKAQSWEQGWMAGFNQPDDERVPPLVAELLEVFNQGVTEGRADKARPLENGQTWCAASELPDVGPSSPEFENISESQKEMIETLAVHTTFELLKEIFENASIGLVGLIFEVVQIPGDVSIKTLEPDFSGPLQEDNIVFLGVCPRTDHSFSDHSPWVGPVRTSFLDAAADLKAHNHPEAFIVRTSIKDGTIGPVWAVK